MYQKRYLFALALYYLPYVLVVRWILARGAPSNAAHALAQVLIAVVYVALSLEMVIARPPARFAFASTPRRIMRWVMYLTLYAGLVFLPALLLLHSDADGFRLALFVPALLFLGMLHSPKGKPAEPDPKEVERVLADDGPRRWMTYYGLYLVTPFAGGMAIAFAVPDEYMAQAVLLLSLAVMVMALWMLHRLTVARPNVRFADLTNAQRRNRFWVHAGLYLAMTMVLPRVLRVLLGDVPPLDTWLMLPLLASAAYGRDMAGAGLLFRPRKPKPRKETGDERLQRRMKEIRAKYPLPQDH